jgi:hypothetical protein
MITLTNTISTDRTYLNLNTVKKVLFFQDCYGDAKHFEEGCTVVFYSDNSVDIVSVLENCYERVEYPDGTSEMKVFEDEDLLPNHLTWQGSSYPVIRDSQLYTALYDLLENQHG